MPRKAKPKQHCMYCGKEILQALDVTNQTWIHAHSGETFSQDVVPHPATPRSQKKS